VKTYSLIGRNLKVARFRSFVIAIAVAVVVGLLFSTFMIELGVGRSTEVGSARLGADILLLPSPLPINLIIYIQWPDPVFIAPTNTTAHLQYLRPRYIDDNGTLDAGIRAIPGVVGVSPQVFVGTLNNSGRPVALVGFDPSTDFTILPWLSAAGQSQTTLGPDAAIVGSDTGFRAGDNITWNSLSLRAMAVLEPTSSTMDRTIFFPIQTAYRLSQTGSSTAPGQNSTSVVGFKVGQISALLVKLARGSDEDQVGRQVSATLNSYVVIYGAIATKQVSLETKGIASYEFLLAGLLGTSVLILTASLMSMSVNERKREFGILRSMGATKLSISRLIMGEAGITSFSGSLLGLVVGAVVFVVSEFYLSQAYSISFIAPSYTEVLWFMLEAAALGVIIGTLAALYPAYRASRMDPYQAITRGE
jgi:putative ABC transport system permease protein